MKDLKGPRPAAPQGPHWLWMHKEVQHYSQSWADFANNCEATAPPRNRLLVVAVTPRLPKISSTPAVPSGPSTPFHSTISEDSHRRSMMAANQGLPRQPDSSPSTLVNRPTTEFEHPAKMTLLNVGSLQLPNLVTPDVPVNAALAKVSGKRFNIETVCAALQNDCSIMCLSDYLGTYVAEQVQGKINEKIAGRATPMFYAIEHAIRNNNLDSIEILLKYGAEANAFMTTTDQPCEIPILAFTIMHASKNRKDSLAIVKRLLSAGAKPSLTPVALTKDAAPVAHWYTMCNEAMTVSHAYFLQRVQKGDAFPKGLKKQLAGVYGLVDLLTIDHYVVGQDHALRLVKDSVFAHIATNSQYPLVMAFAGPSGHGKTEMASQMGRLLSLEITVVDCTHMKHDTDLFGSRNGYKRSEEGSQLNNFLVKHDGERAVVFLDEFDKTPQEIRHSLLLICDSGAYHDRRNNKLVDCSKILWVLATNLGDREIKMFYEEQLQLGAVESNVETSIESLQQELFDKFKDHFGPPFTGRVDVIVPFLPFTEIEQCVMAHSLLVKLADEFRLPIDCRPTVKRYIAHSYLDLGNGVELSQHIAKTCYNPELGARSLKRGIEELKRKFVMVYCDAHPMEVTEDINAQPIRNFRAQIRCKMDGKTEMVVFYLGITTMDNKAAAANVTEVAGRREYDDDPLSDPESSVDNDDDRFLRDKSHSQQREV